MRLLAASPLLSVAASAALAAFPCDALWGERNAIDKNAGEGFRTEGAVRAFGNAGYRYDDWADVPLSARQRADIAGIRRRERENGCTC
ncbi:MAG: YARHG domain-containing protein [Methylorubrum populi]